MKRHILWTTPALWALCAGMAAAQDAPVCGIDAFAALEDAGLVVDLVQAVTADADNPVDHCRVQGNVDPRTGIDGVEYGIGFDLRLPVAWNGSFVHQFNGGADGIIAPALGNLQGGMAGDNALARGYAVVSSNAGHRLDATPEAGASMATTFGLDPQARIDYGYGAVGRLNPLALRMVAAHYGAEAEYVYGVGGSNGGRHALVAAARHPDQFDGLLAAYPGLNLPRTAVQHAWDIQSYLAVNEDPTKAFTPDDLTLLKDAVLGVCDGLDGLEDGLVHNIDACQSSFDINALDCAQGANQCLPSDKIAALAAIHQGPVNSAGEALYSAWPWDTGVGYGGWQAWKTFTNDEASQFLPRIVTLGGAALGYVFTTPPTEIGPEYADVLGFLANFDFDTDAPKIFATDDTFTESALSFMTPPDVDNPALEGFAAAGGKLVIYHGTSDPAFSMLDTDRWFAALDANHGGQAGEFARYYRVPGMVHGRGGAATDIFDIFSPLVAWVEEGTAPDAIAAATGPNNPLGEGISRPLCPYPTYAAYQSGDEKSAESFACAN